MKKLIQLLISFLIAMVIILVIIFLCCLIPLIAIIGGPLMVIGGITWTIWGILFEED